MPDIPVTFKYNSKLYSGHLSKVMGGGSTSTYHLMVERFYWGRLRYSEFSKAWCFDPTPKTMGLEKLADELAGFLPKETC